MIKQTILLAALLALMFSCKKTLGPAGEPADHRLSTVVAQLRDSMTAADFSALDTTTGYLTRVDSGGGGYVRFNFRGISALQRFVLVRMDSAGEVSVGRIVELSGVDTSATFLPGNMRVRALGGAELWSSAMRGGYVLALHPQMMQHRTTMGTAKRVDDLVPAHPDPGELPEVVVIGYPNAGSDDQGISVGNYYLGLNAPLGAGGGNGSAGGGAGGGSSYGSLGGGVSGGSGALVPGPSAKPEAEYDDQLTIVNLQMVLNCFGNDHVPDAGAQYNLEVCADVPINGDPTASSALVPGVSAGHSFLVATKSNNGVSVTQCFGFYPVQTPGVSGMLDNQPSAIKDNGGHEINAMMSRSLTAAQFQAFEQAALFYAGNSYNLLSYNCTDYALNVWNSTGVQNVTVPPMSILVPNGLGGVGTVTIKNTPQGLFDQLSTWQGLGMPGIVVDQSGNFHAPASEGQCPN